MTSRAVVGSSQMRILDRLLERLAAQALVQADGLADLRADGLERIEAGHGVLQDHADLLAAHAEPVLLLFELGKVGIDAVLVLAVEVGGALVLLHAVVADGALVDEAVAVQHSRKRFCEYGFTGAGLSYDSNGLVLVNIQRYAPNCRQDTAADTEFYL